MFIYLYNINIQKLRVTKKFQCNLQFISYIYIIIILKIIISRNTIKSLSRANYPENNIL